MDEKEIGALKQEVYEMRHELDNADRIIGQIQRQNANQQQMINDMSEELRARDVARDSKLDEQLTLLHAGTD